MSQENVEGETEALDELVLLSHASLVVKRSEPYPNERWLLLQGGSPVAAIEPTGSGWALTTTTQRFSAAIQRRRRRLGWYLAVTLPDGRSSMLDYDPATLRAGGTLILADGRRCKLRHRSGWWSGDTWSLVSADGDELARVSLRTKPPTGSAHARDSSGLTPAAANEPDLELLLVAACVALIVHKRAGVMGAGLG
jgi:hypothetical protein